ncbi:MAG: hypothetical protein JW807_10315 [Spirochaetes bacterium]|nr:hypothetical protein [Spirochaetota bacterium]
MIQTTELLNLIFESIGLVVIITLYRFGVIPRYLYLFFAYVSIWIGSICTVAEGFVWYDVFNLLEHLSYVAAGILFIIGFRAYFFREGAGRP